MAETLATIASRKPTRDYKADQVPTELLARVGIPEGFTPVSSAAIGYVTEVAAGAPKPPRSIPTNWA